MGVKLQSSSGGSVEIAAPVTASNYVLTAPAATGTILNDGSALSANKLTGALPAIDGSALTGTGLGVGQTWQNVLASRSKDVTYTNTTGKPIMVFATMSNPANSASDLIITVGGVSIPVHWLRLPTYNTSTGGSFIIPNAETYKISGSYTIDGWFELR